MGFLHACILAGLIGAEPAEPPVIPPLIAALRDKDVEVRAYAGAALAELGSAAVEPLKAALQDADPSLRAGAAYTFGRLGVAASPAKQQLLTCLSDKEREVRRHAAYALSRLFAAEREQAAPVVVPPPEFPKETPPQ